MSTTNWVSCMPEDGVESFTERSDERRQVFEDAARRLPTAELSPLVWAFLQVDGLEQVKGIVQNRYSWRTVKDTHESIFGCEAKDAVLLWKQRPVARNMAKTDTTPASNKRSFSGAFSNHSPSSPLRPQAATPTSEARTRSGKPLGGSEYSPQRDRKIAERCKERDHGLCVVSRIGAVDACHIYPWCAFGGKDRERVRNFWDILRMFWSEDKVDNWYAKLFRDDREEEPREPETVENMLTFTSTLHRFHSEGAFALRPVRMSDDKTQLELEFHWLARQERDSSVMDSGNGYQFCRFDNAKPTLLVSGTRFTMTTDDATNKPLPDPGLLELQWHLQRILAMSGAAGWKEEDFDYDDPRMGVLAPPSVTQWLDDQPAEYRQSRSSSPSESVESVDGAYE
ncbi:hypothetical protein K469DRAFT_731840 [Zopfia rhizophila CBS 207.26]|uniref:HNH nuclease domain-containing protein n=1 Tax=Zopfia rhizophila CBS 207.26 TaxID=1314779 RepID=A0A6A6DIV6_9PEZI|nr:hypothetical protein K469DRAFT_731840 [Zopfia rhizophila CBS 207.26]